MNRKLKFSIAAIALATTIAFGETNSVSLTSTNFPLTPTNLVQMLALPPDQLEKVDIARIDLLCAEGLKGSENLDVQENLETLDRWTAHVKEEIVRNYHRFLEHPEEYKNSEAYYRMAMLTMVLQEDFNVHYDPKRALPQLRGERESNDVFYADSKDIFIHGILGEERHGTCSSLPVLYAAVAQRLGYPVDLASTEEHFYLRYEGGTNHLNVDASGEGFITESDEDYRKWPHQITDEEIKTYGWLKPLNHARILGALLAIRAMNLTSAKRFDEAAQSWDDVSHYLSPTPVLNRIVELAKERAADVHKAERWDELWNAVVTQPIPEDALDYFQNRQAKILEFMNQSADLEAIEKAVADLKDEVNEYAKERGAFPPDAINFQNSDAPLRKQIRYRTSLVPPPLRLLQVSEPDDSLAQWAMSPLSQRRIRIPAERVPPQYWQKIPEDLQKRLNNLNNVDQIVAEMWQYYTEQVNQQNREMMAKMSQPPQTQPSLLQPQDWHAQLEQENEKRREEMKAMLLKSYTPGDPDQQNLQLTRPPIQIEIIPPKVGEP